MLGLVTTVITGLKKLKYQNEGLYNISQQFEVEFNFCFICWSCEINFNSSSASLANLPCILWLCWKLWAWQIIWSLSKESCHYWWYFVNFLCLLSSDWRMW